MVVRVLVGTRKGGYVVESNSARTRWTVRGPFEPGKDVFHVVGDPRHPGHLYAAVNSGWFGPKLVRSRNWGRQWQEIPPPMMATVKARPPPSFEGPRNDPITNLWHIEPGPSDEPKSLYVGVDPAALYRSDDFGSTWNAVTGLNEHETRPKWNPGAGGMCLHTILIDPTRPKRMYVGISAAGSFRSDDGGAHWTARNHGVRVTFQPDHYPEVGQCVHKFALDPAHPETIYRQDHDGIYVSHDAMDSWKRIGRPLPYDFGFVVTAPRATPGTAYFMPLEPRSRTTLAGGFQVYRWTERDRSWTRLVRPGSFPGQFGVHREGMASDSLDPAGLYVGTTTGQLFASSDAGRRWRIVPFQFPSIHSVAVAGT